MQFVPCTDDEDMKPERIQPNMVDGNVHPEVCELTLYQLLGRATNLAHRGRAHASALSQGGRANRLEHVHRDLERIMATIYAYDLDVRA